MTGLSRSRRPTCVRIEGPSRRPRLPTQPGARTAFSAREEAQALPWPIRPEAFVSCECLTPDPWSQTGTGPGS